MDISKMYITNINNLTTPSMKLRSVLEIMYFDTSLAARYGRTINNPIAKNIDKITVTAIRTDSNLSLRIFLPTSSILVSPGTVHRS